MCVLQSSSTVSSLQAQQKQFACTDDGDGDDQPNKHTNKQHTGTQHIRQHVDTRQGLTHTHTGGTPFE